MSASEEPVDRNRVTALLKRAMKGDEAAQGKLAPLVYQELRRRAGQLMYREGRAHSVQATMLVNDAFMHLVDAPNLDLQSRGHFFALASQVMRRVLVDRARARARQKRGGGAEHVQLMGDTHTLSIERDADVLALEAALKRLAEVDPAQAEIVTMRFFGGMSMPEIAEALGMSKRTCEREWTFIKAWLRRELSE